MPSPTYPDRYYIFLAFPALLLSVYAVVRVNEYGSSSPTDPLPAWRRYEYVSNSRRALPDTVRTVQTSKGEFACRTTVRVWDLVDTPPLPTRAEALEEEVTEPTTLAITDSFVRPANGSAELVCETSDDGHQFYNSVVCSTETGLCEAYGSSCAQCISPLLEDRVVYQLGSSEFDVAVFSLQGRAVELAYERGATNLLKRMDRSHFAVRVQGEDGDAPLAIVAYAREPYFSLVAAAPSRSYVDSLTFAQRNLTAYRPA